MMRTEDRSQESVVRSQNGKSGIDYGATLRIPGWLRIDNAGLDYLARCVMFAVNEPEAEPVPVPASWAAPVVQWMKLIEEAATESDTDAIFLKWMAEHLSYLPRLINEMDHEALASVLESSMAESIVEGASNALAKVDPAAALSTFAVELPSVTSGPIAEAVAKLGQRSPVAVKLTSFQWSRVPMALRERAQFSARVESARFLQGLQDKVSARLSWAKEQIAKSDKAAGGEAFFDRSSFIADMREIAIEEGIDTTTPDKYGTVRDIRSAKRLGLIWDMQNMQAQEFARWKMDQDPDVLDAYPAQRFTRIEDRMVPRTDWPIRWAEAYAKVNGVGASMDEMVALKTSRIWEKLSIFGTPWPPFDWGSGMGLVDVDRAEAEALGLIKPDETLQSERDPGFNSGFEMGVRDLSQDKVDWLLKTFGDRVTVDDGALKWATTT